MADVLHRWDVRAWANEASSSRKGRWERVARPEQLPPTGDWQTWLILAGRGWGKTRAAAEYVADLARRYPGARIALVAATFADGRDTMVEGMSGLLDVLDDVELRGGTQDSAWNRSLGELFLANGSRFKVYSSEKPRQLRGPQHHFAWCDEAAAWFDAHKGTARDTTWSNLMFGLRLPAKEGWSSDYRTRVVVATTPRNVALLKVPETLAERKPEFAGITQRKSTVITRGPTRDNLANLSEEFKAEVIDPLAGTALARQELEGEILDEADGALITRAAVEACGINLGEVFEMLDSAARVVAVDPAVSTGENSDLTGISVVARGYDGKVYVLGDHSLKGTPQEWAFTVWAAVYAYRASAIVVENNQGGQMVEHTLQSAWPGFATAWMRDPHRLAGELTGERVDAIRQASRARLNEAARIDTLMALRDVGVPRPRPIHTVHPSGPNSGKWIRAQPVRLMYERGQIKHVRHPNDPLHFMYLEEELTSWTGSRGEKSPDRLDALVHGVDFLLHPKERAKFEALRQSRPRFAARYR